MQIPDQPVPRTDTHNTCVCPSTMLEGKVSLHKGLSNQCRVQGYRTCTVSSNAVVYVLQVVHNAKYRICTVLI